RKGLSAAPRIPPARAPAGGRGSAAEFEEQQRASRDLIFVADCKATHRLLAAALTYAGGAGTSVHHHAETTHIAVAPILGAHFDADGIDPGQILDLQFLVVVAGQEAIAPQNGVLVTQSRELLHEAHQ